MKQESSLSKSSELSVGSRLKRDRKKILSAKYTPYIMITPFVISFLLFFLYPIIKTVIMSFQSIYPGETTFIGWENYRKLFNPRFYTAVFNTAVYTLWTLIILIPIPMILAVILNSKLTPWRNVFRSALFIPALTSVIVAGVIFRLIFGESELSLANSLLTMLGFSPQQWMMNWGTGMFLMVFLASWRWMGVNILYFLAGLQNIPKELYEAAEIDGAGPIKKFFRITLPMLKPVTIYVLTISIYGGFRMFEESYVYWENNSPGDIGLTITGYIYQEGFQNFDLGFAAAIGLVLLLIILLINTVQLQFFGLFRKENS